MYQSQRPPFSDVLSKIESVRPLIITNTSVKFGTIPSYIGQISTYHENCEKKQMQHKSVVVTQYVYKLNRLVCHVKYINFSTILSHRC